MLCYCFHDFGWEVGEIGGVDHAHRGGAWAEHGDADTEMECDRFCRQERMRNTFSMKILHTLEIRKKNNNAKDYIVAVVIAVASYCIHV